MCGEMCMILPINVLNSAGMNFNNSNTKPINFTNNLRHLILIKRLRLSRYREYVSHQ